MLDIFYDIIFYKRKIVIKMQNISQEEFKQKYNYNAATPMMQQYLDLKYENIDSLLLFRMGDFYELFFDDAIKASKILGIALAKRGKNDNEDIPMCGVPHHALENYLNKLLEEGLKVAICDQKETPEEAKKRAGYKAVVKREIVRVITPGTVIESSILDSHKPNYLLSLNENNGEIAIAYCDVSTCEFVVSSVNMRNLQNELVRINPSEILLPQKIQKHDLLPQILKNYDLKLVYQVDHAFDLNKSIRIIENLYNINSYKSIGSFSNIQITAIGSLLQYLSITQKENIPKLEKPKYFEINSHMVIDHATRKSLEITENLSGGRKGTLLASIDNTVTKGGSRLLYNYLNAPLTNINTIKRRYEITQFFIDNYQLSNDIRDILRNSPDIERVLSRIFMNRASVFDILSLKEILEKILLIKEIIFNKYGIKDLSDVLSNILSYLNFDFGLYNEINSIINDNAPNNLQDGGVIKDGFHTKIDELRSLIFNSREHIENLRNKYQKITLVDNLKISTNNIIGMYIEVTNRHVDKITDPIFIHKQSTNNSARFTTEELKELEYQMTNAHTSLISLENEIFRDLCRKISDNSENLSKLAIAINQIDLFINFAILSVENNYIIPEITDDISLEIFQGRHPIVEDSLKAKHENFVPNNCILNEDIRLWLITGPNMGGKSTFLRQNALIVILAQIGCFTPAYKAKIGIVDKILSRIGSGDDLSSGQSTFMVEMTETASILSQATQKSFVILDEVGRGTSTYDGMAIARAIIEYIHSKIKCRCLFATHYHELTDLSSSLMGVKNYTLSVEEQSGKIIFLHKIKEGCADKSYGIHVAELAGIPAVIIQKAKNILNKIEKTNEVKNVKNLNMESSNMSIFTINDEKLEKLDLLENFCRKIANINIDEISPKMALDLIYNLQKDAKDVS